jgi:putative cell wall-binding protein/peptidoglycan hydrolase-like protein with peptidoglycan-binding domain
MVSRRFRKRRMSKKSVRLCDVGAGAVLFAVLWFGVFSAGAYATPEYSSLRGADRYETAVKVSQAGYSPGVGAVVLATGEDFPDALSAAPLASAYDGPVLLTHKATLDEVTAVEIARLTPGKIFLVGLEPALVAQVEAAFPELAASDGGIVVLAGTDRYDTARLVAAEVKARLGSVTGVIVAPGDSFADALSAAPLAAAQGWPILLTPGTGPLPEATTQALADLGAPAALVVGTRVGLGAPALAVTYIAGADRYDTCVRIAAYAVGQGLSYSQLGLATGEKFPDALAAGPYLGKNGGVLLLTRSSSVPPVTSQVLLEHADEVQTVTYMGLESAVTGQVSLLLSATDLPDGFTFSSVRTGSQGAEVLWLEQKLTELTYRPGPIDGVFDKKTYQAVLAFQKWEGLSRDGVVGTKVWARLLSASQPYPSKSGSGAWLEVNKSKQVLLWVEDGTITRTLAVSTGNADVGIVTPSQAFTVYAKSAQWDGPRYKPLYLRGILAIHGYPSVPAYPASHGCVRVPLWDMDELFPLVAVGTKVYVY